MIDKLKYIFAFFLLVTLFGCAFSPQGLLPRRTEVNESPTGAIFEFTPSVTSVLPTQYISPTLETTAIPTITITPPPSATATTVPTPSPIQLKVFEELWGIVNEEYLYPDFNGLDWDAVYKEYSARINVGMSEEEFYDAMDEMLYRLGDDHSVFFNPEQAAQEDQDFTGEYDYVGIGIMTVPVLEEQRITIISIFPGSPAEEAGLKPRDSILAADGHPIIKQGRVRRDLLRGPEGTQVTLSILSPEGEPRDVPVTRRRITGSIAVPNQVIQSPSGKRIGYIFLVGFNDSTIDEQVGEAMKAMSADSQLDGLIIDNRMNSGGASNVLYGTLSYFTDGKMGYFVNRQVEEPFMVDGVDIKGSQNVPLVVLTGPETISFGEVFSGILQDIGRAYLIGEATRGNVEILYVYQLADGSRAWIAHDSFRPLNQPQQLWEQSGVIPDLHVISQWDQVTLRNDPAVNAALIYFDEN